MKSLVLSLIIARALDAGTSCAAFQRGAVELNPALPSSCGPTITTHAIVGTVQIWSITTLSVNHPTLAKWIGGLSLGVSGTAIAWNVHILKRMP